MAGSTSSSAARRVVTGGTSGRPGRRRGRPHRRASSAGTRTCPRPRPCCWPTTRCCCPGWSTRHVHVNEPGRTEWEGFATATAAAAAGGVTTIVDMPLNSIPPTVDRRRAGGEAAGRARASATWTSASGAARCPATLGAPAARCTRPACSASSASWSTAGCPSSRRSTRAELAAALAEVAAFDALLIVHAEDAGDDRRGAGRAGRAYADFLASRPPRPRTRAIAGLLDAARRTGARVHVVHLSGRRRAAAARGGAARAASRSRAETCPHYLTLAAEESRTARTSSSAARRSADAANRDALWAGLADGTIDCVVSDHSPCTPELKLPGRPGTSARPGAGSPRCSWACRWCGPRAGAGRRLADVVALDVRGAGRAGRAGRQGRASRPAATPTWCAFAPDEAFVVDPARLHHRHPVTPYAGRRADRGGPRRPGCAGPRRRRRRVAAEPRGRC